MILYATSSFNLFKDVWLIDSGVGTHVACFLKNLESYQTIPNKTITLPNRTIVPIVVVGIVHISPTLLLHNIFYVPQFNSNLLYVSVFLLHNNFFVTFLKNHFFHSADVLLHEYWEG